MYMSALDRPENAGSHLKTRRREQLICAVEAPECSKGAFHPRSFGFPNKLHSQANARKYIDFCGRHQSVVSIA